LIVHIYSYGNYHSAGCHPICCSSGTNYSLHFLTSEAFVTQFRVLFISGVFILVLSGVFVYRLALPTEITKQSYRREYTWVACKVHAELFGLAYPSWCDTDTNPTRRSKLNYLATNVALATLGFFAFLALSTKKEVYLQWSILLGCVKRREFSRAWRRIKYGFEIENPPLIVLQTNTPPITSSTSGSTFASLFPTGTTSSAERETRNTFMSMASRYQESVDSDTRPISGNSDVSSKSETSENTEENENENENENEGVL